MRVPSGLLLQHMYHVVQQMSRAMLSKILGIMRHDVRWKAMLASKSSLINAKQTAFKCQHLVKAPSLRARHQELVPRPLTLSRGRMQHSLGRAPMGDASRNSIIYSTDTSACIKVLCDDTVNTRTSVRILACCAVH